MELEQKEKSPKKKSLGLNYIYNLLYQIFLIIVPLATTPYIARVLGDDGSGKYSFCFSIVTYFILFASLGFNIYGQRETSKYQDDIKTQSKVFWEIFICRFIPFIITIIIFIGMIVLNVYSKEYNNLILIFGLQIVATVFDVTFLFQANEEFGIVVLRNFIIKLITIVCIFVFVRERNDLSIYVFIQSISVLVSSLSLWVSLPRCLTKVSIKNLHPLKHLVPTLILFLPTIATSVYTSLDKTLIGVLVEGTTSVVLPDGSLVIKNIADIENGNYEYAEKVVKLTFTIVTALGIVMIPRNSKMFKDNDIEGVKNNIYKSLKYVFFIALPLMFGLILISDIFIPWFLGDDYKKAIGLMKLLSPLVLIIGISNVFGLQYLIPAGKDKKFTIAITSGALCNLVLNLILIRFIQSYGAAIGTVIAELLIAVIMYFMVRKDISIKIVFKNCWKFVVASVVMLVVGLLVSTVISTNLIGLVILVLVSVIVYLVILIILKEEYIKIGLDFIKSKLSR